MICGAVAVFVILIIILIKVRRNKKRNSEKNKIPDIEQNDQADVETVMLFDEQPVKNSNLSFNVTRDITFVSTNEKLPGGNGKTGE